MAKIEIKDLPQKIKISSQEMRAVMGGAHNDHSRIRLTASPKRRENLFPGSLSPWFFGAIVATAIAVPLSPGDDHDDGA